MELRANDLQALFKRVSYTSHSGTVTRRPGTRLPAAIATLRLPDNSVHSERGSTMYQVIGKCPICGGELTVTRLHCRNCDSALEGHFNLGKFYRLTPEQLHFVETFIKCEGKITRVEDELGLSYPTVRNRLNEVIRALGYEVPAEATMSAERRREILAQLQAGEIAADEAAELLKSVER
jgi:hypothetical protein